jgi:hypothetical protein
VLCPFLGRVAAAGEDRKDEKDEKNGLAIPAAKKPHVNLRYVFFIAELNKQASCQDEHYGSISPGGLLAI